MSDEQNFDARNFAAKCLSDAVDAIDQAHASLSSAGVGDGMTSQPSVQDADPEVEEELIRAMGYGFIGQEIYADLFDGCDEETAVVIARLDALSDRYDPEAPRWRAADYTDYDDFWTSFSEDFGWPEYLAEKIVALDNPGFFSGVSLKLRDIAAVPQED